MMATFSGTIDRTDPLKQYVAELERTKGIPPGLLTELVHQESRWNPKAVSPAGAQGLAQIMPATARQPGFGVPPLSDAFDPKENLRFGADYLSAMLKRYGGDKEAALVAYNAGPGVADKWVRSKDDKLLADETKNYKKTILGRLADVVIPQAVASDVPNEDFLNIERELFPETENAGAINRETEDLSAIEAELFGDEGDFRTPGTPAYERVRSENVLRAQFQEPGREAPAPLSADETRQERRGLGVIEPLLGYGQLLTGNEGAAGRAAREVSTVQDEIAPEGIDWARMSGNVAAVAPLAAALPVGASAGGAALYGAATGALTGALAPVKETDNFASEKAAQVGGGALAGAVAGPAGRAVGNQINSLVVGISNTAKRLLSGKLSPQKAQTILEMELSTQGIDFKQLSKAAQEDLKKQVASAMKTGGQVNPEAIANLAAFKELGIRPTKGQITRDPKQWQDEFNLRQLTGGERLMNQYRDATVGLSRNLNEARAATGGADITPYAAGEQAIKTLSTADRTIKGNVDTAYDAARSQVGIQTPLNSRSFADRVIQQLDDQQVGDKLPGAFRDTLNRISKGEFPFTIQKAEQVLRAANQRASGTSDKVERFALGIFQKELRDAIDQAGSAEGKAAATAFQDARKLASGRFQLHEAVPALKAVSDGDITPDDFLKKFVVGAKVQELGKLKRFLLTPSNGTQGVQSWNNIRAQLIDKLKAASFQGEGTDIRFLQASYNKALNSVPQEKLSILFSPKEIQKLRLIGKAGRAIQQEPTGAVPNRSGTAAALFNRLGSVLEAVPGLGPLGGVIVRGTVKAGQGGANALKSSRAMGKAPIVTPRNDLLPKDIRDLLVRGAALGGAGSLNSLLQ